jgi:hypothetical protein
MFGDYAFYFRYCMSCGLDVEKRMRIFGKPTATISSNWSNQQQLPLHFCGSDKIFSNHRHTKGNYVLPQKLW